MEGTEIHRDIFETTYAPRPRREWTSVTHVSNWGLTETLNNYETNGWNVYEILPEHSRTDGVYFTVVFERDKETT